MIAARGNSRLIFVNDAVPPAAGLAFDEMNPFIAPLSQRWRIFV
jgi:hypothetical protein